MFVARVLIVVVGSIAGFDRLSRSPFCICSLSSVASGVVGFSRRE